MKSRIPLETEACIVANPTASCWPANVRSAATTSTRMTVSVNEDNTGGNLSFRSKRWAGCSKVASSAAMSNGMTSRETCDSNQTATADIVIINSTRQDHAAATTIPYGISDASFSCTRDATEP